MDVVNQININQEHHERNYGIDLLRLLSMFMVVVVHILGKGGVLISVQPLTIKGEASYFLMIFCYCAVNVFAIISGYVGYKAKQNYVKLTTLCLQLFFYSFIYTLLYIGLSFHYETEISIKECIKNLFPSIKNLWYFSAYFCLFFFMPVLRIIVDNTPKKTLKIIGVFIFIVFLCVTQIYSNVADLDRGFSFLWLAILFVIGAYLAKYKPFEKMSCGKSILAFLICVVITEASRILIAIFNLKTGRSINVNILQCYTSPTILLSAVFLLNVFAQIRTNKAFSKIILFLSPMTFGVYLIHCHPFVFVKFINAFTWIANYPTALLLLIVIGVALAIFIFCMFIDWIRLMFFKLINIKAFANCINKVIVNIVKLFLRLFRMSIEDDEIEETSKEPCSRL